MNTTTVAVKSAISKVIEKVAPSITRHAKVRYDAQTKKWGIIQTDGKALEHFDYAIMKDVTFSNQVKRAPGIGCGSGTTDMIGFAEGELFIGKHTMSIVGLRSIGFDRDSGNFRSNDGMSIHNAKYLYLQPNRHAFYTEA